MNQLEFTKMAGAGNDFILVDNRRRQISNGAKLAKIFCDRKNSIGGDGLILIEKSKKADARMRIFNPDGSEAEMCGNGVRCFAKFAADEKITKPKLSVETLVGIIHAEVRGTVVKAKMINPRDLRLNLRVPVNGSQEHFSFINTGVPHAVQLANSLDSTDVAGLGREIRFHEYFAPKGTNVDFISLHSGNAIKIRTYERGVEAETLSCGTGSTAGALVAAALKNLKSPVLVHTQSGEVLKIYFSKKDGKFYDVYLEGRVRTIFEGRIGL